MLVNEMIEKLKHRSWTVMPGEFRETEGKPSNRRDLCAMIIFDRLAPPAPKDVNPAIRSTHSREIHFRYSLEEIAEVITDSDIEMLAVCGVDIYFGSWLNQLEGVSIRPHFFMRIKDPT